VSFTFNAAESVTLIGPSGCGKTTLAKVMLGLLTPLEGKILADGVDINKMGLSNFRRRIAAVMQDDQLLSRSMFDNISFFDPSIDEQKVMECAQMAAIHTDIAAMPMAYNALIGDMGRPDNSVKSRGIDRG
jgi:ATP-binding cassette subfamily B protein RaxB